MKKITVMLTALVLFTAASLFAQSRPMESMSINYGKITYNPATAAKDSIKNKAAAKPEAPKPAATPQPGTKISAQSRPTESMNLNYTKVKITYPATAAKDSVKDKTAAKPAVKPQPGTKIAQPKPGTKATADYLLKIEPVEGESKN